MPNTILHKRTSTTGVTPAANSLTPGELAINTADGRIFTKTSSGTVITFSNTSPIFATSVLTSDTGTFNVFNTNATTVNAFGAATTVNIGASTGTTTVGNSLSVNKSITASEGYRLGTNAINAQVGTTYSLDAADNGRIVTFNSSSAVTVTVPTGLPTNFTCTVIALGTGKVTLSQSSTTLNWYGGTGNIAIAGQHGAATLVMYTANTFNVSGTLQ
jgi:hypothetical protein